MLRWAHRAEKRFRMIVTTQRVGQIEFRTRQQKLAESLPVELELRLRYTAGLWLHFFVHVFRIPGEFKF